MFASPPPAAAASPSPPPAGAEGEEVQTLPVALSSQLPDCTRALCHSAAATRLMLVGEARAGSATHALCELQLDVVHVGQVAQLLHSWARIFVQQQTAAPTLNPRLNPHASADEWYALLLSLSRAYRAELETCLLDAATQLQSQHVDSTLMAELQAHNIEMDDYKYTLLLLETCKSLLHLLEIVYLDPHINLTAQMVDWTHRTLQMPRVELSDEAAAAEEEEQAGSGMRDRDEHWQCVYRMLLQGRLYEAIQMLESCTELLGPGSPHRALMRSVMDAVETVPAIAYRQQQQQPQEQTGSKGMSAEEAAAQVPLDQFLQSFHAWQRAVRELRRSPVLASHPHEHIDLLLQVLLGDDQSMLSVAGVNYLEYFLGTLLYVKPHAQRREMKDLLEKCMTACEEQWRRERRQAAEADGGMGDDGSDSDSDSLYTPIDTLRFHLISSDISSALTVLNSMLDLRFFLAHVVALLDARGDILHHETEVEAVKIGGQVVQLPKPLRLNHSPINDSITLLEFHLISYAETLEAASASVSSGSEGSGSGAEMMWSLAVEYYAASPENGRGYLVNLLRKQTLTLDRAMPTPSGAPTVVRRVDARKVHRLLAIAARFRLSEEYNHVLSMAGNLCMQQGCDALRIAGASEAQAAAPHVDAGAFGQAVHWYSMIQPDVASGRVVLSVSRVSIARMEALAEVLLDQLLLRPDAPVRQQRAALQGVVGALAHLPHSVLIPLDVLVSTEEKMRPAALQSTDVSPLLSFLSAYYAYQALWLRMQQAAREIEQKSNDTGAAAPGGGSSNVGGSDAMDMGDAVAPSSAAPSSSLPSLTAALALHAHFHSQCVSLLVSLLRQCDSLLAHHRQYWLPLVQQLVHLLEERASHLSATQRAERRARRQHAAALTQGADTLTYFQLQHPAFATPAALPPPAPVSPLPMHTLTHVQRLLTTLLYSNSAKLYSAPIGGTAGVQRLQQALSTATSCAILRRA